MVKEEKAPEIKCNMLLIGKSGAGKSSFANYLFGADRFTTGTGMPVTKWENNFQNFSLNMSNVQITIYDSVGLEPDNFSAWMQKLDAFLYEKQIRKSALTVAVPPANEIMHILFYVVNGAGARFEPNELAHLQRIYAAHKIAITIIITNCDVASEAQMREIEKEAGNHGFEAIRVCSVSRKTRGGEQKERFGRGQALEKILAASYEKVGKELLIAVYVRLIGFMEETKTRLKTRVDNSDLSIFRLNEMESDFDAITGGLDSLADKFSDENEFIPPSYKNYYNFMNDFDIQYQGRDVFNESFEKISSFLEGFDAENISLARKMERISEEIEDGNIFEKIGAVIKAGGTILFIKQNIKKAIDEMFGVFISQFYSQLLVIQRS